MQSFAPPAARLSGDLPLWYQVAQHLTDALRGRPAGAPTRLPPETELARHYGVGLSTLREALARLEQDGLIARHRRRGTFALPTPAPSPPLELTGPLEALLAQQEAEETQVLGRDRVPVPEHLADRFPAARELIRIRRLRRHGGEPLSLAVNWLPVEIGEAVPLERLARWPMTRVLRDAMGLRPARIEAQAEAQLPAPEVARLLEVPLLSPVLVVTSATRDGAGGLLDLARLHYRGDRFRFGVSFDIPPAGG
jgi:GntR family transcriptional regulator